MSTVLPSFVNDWVRVQPTVTTTPPPPPPLTGASLGVTTFLSVLSYNQITVIESRWEKKLMSSTKTCWIVCSERFTITTIIRVLVIIIVVVIIIIIIVIVIFIIVVVAVFFFFFFVTFVILSLTWTKNERGGFVRFLVWMTFSQPKSRLVSAVLTLSELHSAETPASPILLPRTLDLLFDC